jgi:regulatory protein
VDAELARQMVPEDPEVELASALTLARRRRIGPFRDGEADEAGRRRELGVLARAGFPRPVAARALEMEGDEAEEIVLALRR